MAVNMLCHEAICSSGFIWQSTSVMPGMKQLPEDICPSIPIAISILAMPRNDVARNAAIRMPTNVFAHAEVIGIIVAERICIKKARPSPVSAHSISKRIPPRKRKSMERRERGEGGRADQREALVASRYHASGAYERVPSHHALGAWESVGIVGKIGSSGVVNTHQYRNKVVFALAFFAPHQRKPVRFGRAARFARVEGEVQKFKSRRFLEGGFF